MLVIKNCLLCSNWLILFWIFSNGVIHGKPTVGRNAFGAWTDGTDSKRKCGTITTRMGRIIGGEPSFEGEFPWVSSLTSIIGHFCSAFAISDLHLISAAHCFHQKLNNFLKYTDSGEVILNSINVTLGEFSLESPEKVSSISVPIEKLVIHPDYQPSTKENDIAIIKLNKSISSLHPKVEPICLPGIQYRSEGNGTAVTVGWGRTKIGQDYWDWLLNTDVLRKVNVPLWEDQKCAEEYIMYNFPSKSFICAGEIGRGSCDGDSGGPLQVLSNNKWTAIGVVSAGRKCGSEGKPGIYTDIYSKLNWIHEQISFT